MANIKVSEMTEATEFDDLDYTMIVQANQNKKIARDNLFKSVTDSIGVVETNVENIVNTMEENNKTIFKDLISASKTATSSDYSTSKQGFLPFVSTGTYDIDIQIGNNLSWTTKTVSLEDITGETYGIQIPAGISLLKVEANVRYQNGGSSQINVNTMICCDRNDITTVLRSMSQSVPSGARYTCNFGAYVPVEEGDFIYIGSWKSNASANVSVSSVDNATGVMTEVLQYE